MPMAASSPSLAPTAGCVVPRRRRLKKHTLSGHCDVQPAAAAALVGTAAAWLLACMPACSSGTRKDAATVTAAAEMVDEDQRGGARRCAVQCWLRVGDRTWGGGGSARHRWARGDKVRESMYLKLGTVRWLAAADCPNVCAHTQAVQRTDRKGWMMLAAISRSDC